MKTKSDTQGGEPLADAPFSDASVIVDNGYYRLKTENEKLLRIVDDLYRLIVIHHSSTVMREDLVICTECTSRTGRQILDRAWDALHPNGRDERQTPGE